jgi:RHS repeat-associated protein
MAENHRKANPSSGNSSGKNTNAAVQPAAVQDKPAPGKSSFTVAIPSISLPKGGGAIKGVDEKFSVNAVNGTAGFSLPLPFSPARGFTPSLTLDYNSGSGNSSFGLGWSLSLPSIKRKTDKELPQYLDETASDTFIMAGAEDLVPCFKKDNAGNIIRDADGNALPDEDPLQLAGIGYQVKRYQPRIEGTFARIERWTDQATRIIHWRVISKTNVTTIYGKQSAGRIANPVLPRQIYEWLPEFTYDDKGNCAVYEYKQEDLTGIDPLQVHNVNRLNGNAPFTNTYLKRVRYGNITPYIDHAAPPPTAFMFETVLDYGEHDAARVPFNSTGNWDHRPDAFSMYRAGFEIRTCRLCKRVLLYHHFAELPGGSALVRSLTLNYTNNGEPGFTFLSSVTLLGYTKHDDGTYTQKAAPPFSFDYQPHAWNETVQTIGPDSLVHAPAGSDNSRYQFVDLYGEGLPGMLTEQGNGWFYKSNLGNGVFTDAKSVATKPSFTGWPQQLQLLDLEGNGIKHLTHWEAEPKGFFTLSPEAEWQLFQTFDQFPNIDVTDPNLRLIDLNGDGQADLLITEQDVLTWYPSKGTKGFDVSKKITKPFDEEKGPAIVFADKTQTIFLADMNGDGLTDIVRIRNGETCYWPHLGHGQFGAKVNMDLAPYFENPDQFQPSLIQLADIDGSGTTDIIYTKPDGLFIWLNQHGNGFLPQPKQITCFPHVNKQSVVTVTDLLGTGMSCIVWNSVLPADKAAPLRYIDLMDSRKPHLMMAYRNNRGKEVMMEYKPSTEFYIADKMAGKPWVTKLHFPVHCVSKVVVHDRIRKIQVASTYSYHHGYYDHHEKEFRGFGRVEQIDVEQTAHYTGELLNQPPVLTKTWYHTGAFLDRERVLHQFKDDYNSFTVAGENLLPDIVLPNNLSIDEYRQAHRACKGMLLRKEIYALDANPVKEALPYAVEQHNCLIKIVQPKEYNKHAIFLAHESEAITWHYEREIGDPRIAHSFILDIDRYGNVLQQASVVYPRKPAAGNKPEQEKMYIIVTENTFTNAVGEPLAHRTPLPHVTKTYEVTGIATPAGYLTLEGLLGDLATAGTIDYEVQPTIGIQKRLIEFVRSQYRGDDGVTVLPFGDLQSKGLPHQSYKAAFTRAILEPVFNEKIAWAALEALLTGSQEGAYVFADDYYWITSGTQNYEPNNFYISTLFTDPFGNDTNVAYDNNYFLFVERVTDALQNESRVIGFNYRLLLPYRMQDANDNVTAARFDELGMATRSFIVGKSGIDEGDVFDNTRVEMKGANDFPSVMMEYDLLCWYTQTEEATFDLTNYKPRPCFVKTQQRETHYNAHPLHETRFQESYTYSDGNGQVLLKKTQAEPGEALQVNPDGTVTTIPDTFPNLRWIGNGRTILNNKGNPVKQYEPYFSVAPSFDDEKEMPALGTPSIFYYDPMGRNMRTVFPDKTFSKVEFTPWLQKTFDANDTVRDSEWYSNLGSPDPDAPAPANPQQRAAWLAAAHHDTPAIAHLDTLGRTFLTLADKGLRFLNAGEISGDHLLNHLVELDIENNELAMKDAMNRTVMAFTYDMLGNAVRQISMDAGRRWTLNNCIGKPLLTWDDRDHTFHFQYDKLQRPQQSSVTILNGAPLVYQKIEYGESLPQATAKANNLLGFVYKTFDQSGISINHSYDFKGNIATSSKQYLANYKTMIDWDGPVDPEAAVYESNTSYDALNRPVKQVTPHSAAQPASELVHTFNEAGLLDNVTAVVRGEPTSTTFVSNINYNSKGQRVNIFYGNNTRTSYEYDPLSFRLTRILTTRNAGEILQDLRYIYDPAGNITQVRDWAQPDIFFDNEQIRAVNNYTYDALYRLIEATGRKHAGQTDIQPKANLSGNTTFRNQPFIPHAVISPNDANAFRNYTEKYVYDRAGNMLAQQHTAQNSSWTREFVYDEGNDTNNRLTQTAIVGSGDTYDYTYDAHGNMYGLETVMGETWDFMDRFREAGLGGGGRAWYVYDANGQRVRKVIERQNGRREERLYLGNMEVYSEWASAGTILVERETLHVMDDRHRIAMVDLKIRTDGSVEEKMNRYQFSNNLGSASLELDDAPSPNIISYEEYFPYGTTSYYIVDTNREVPAKRYRYTGKERDEESGLSYHGARYYALWLCRWTAADPSGTEDGPNMYSYVSSNPVKLVDDTGQKGDKVDYEKAPPLIIAQKDPEIAKLLKGQKIEGQTPAQRPVASNATNKDNKVWKLSIGRNKTSSSSTQVDPKKKDVIKLDIATDFSSGHEEKFRKSLKGTDKERYETIFASKLHHELIHTQLRIEEHKANNDPGLSATSKEFRAYKAKFEVFRKPIEAAIKDYRNLANAAAKVANPNLPADRLLTAEDTSNVFDKLVEEKFVYDKINALYGDTVSNKEIADAYVRNFLGNLAFEKTQFGRTNDDPESANGRSARLSRFDGIMSDKTAWLQKGLKLMYDAQDQKYDDIELYQPDTVIQPQPLQLNGNPVKY